MFRNYKKSSGHSKCSSLTSGGQYRGPVTCPGGLWGTFWTWREAAGWIHWRSNWCFNLVAAYKIPMWLLNKGRNKASGIVRYSGTDTALCSIITWMNSNTCIVYRCSTLHAYRSLMKCGMAIKKVPKDIKTHPIEMILGRWSLAPKWLTKAITNKFPTGKRWYRGDWDESKALKMRLTEEKRFSEYSFYIHWNFSKGRNTAEWFICQKNYCTVVTKLTSLQELLVVKEKSLCIHTFIQYNT